MKLYKNVSASKAIKASAYDEDRSSAVAEGIKHCLFTADGAPQYSANGDVHGLDFVTWAGDGHSFIVNDDDNEYRVTIQREL